MSSFDALLIAEVIRFGCYKSSSVPQEELLALRELCRNRFYLMDLASDLKHKMVDTADIHVSHSCSLFFYFLPKRHTALGIYQR